MKNKKLYLFILAGLVLISAVAVQERNSRAAAVNCADPNERVAYTCAMHTDLQQSEPGQCAVCGMNLVQNVFKYSGDPDRSMLTPLATELAGIELATVKTVSAVSRELRLNGRVVPDERRVYHQIAHLPGTIEKLHVNTTGGYIRKGQPVASIYSKDLIAVLEAFEYSKNSEAVLRSAENSLRSYKVDKKILRDIDFKKGGYQKAIDVYADFSGVVLNKRVNVGDHTGNPHMGGESTVLFDLADLSRVWVLFDVPESDLGWLKRGDRIRFGVPAWPGREFNAAITLVEPMINPETRTATVRVEVDNREGLLKPDMLATGVVQAREKLPRPAVVVPRSAVLWTGDRSVVYVRDSSYTNPVFEYRQVELGGAVGDHFLVVKGVREGESIVANGAFRVDAAAQLSRKHSMLNPGRAPGASPLAGGAAAGR
jgi:Cu(I)/Ag(I) efflux system membrane fusion protein